MSKTIAIDEEGYFLLQNGVRLNDDTVGQEMLKNLNQDEFGVIHLNYQGEQVIVEPFDKPLVASQVEIKENQLFLLLPYQAQIEADLETLCLDEWDRFHGLTKTGLPFVLSRKAQAELFNTASGFSDDSITLGSQEIETKDFYIPSSDANDEKFWQTKYKENPSPPWNLNEVHPELKTTLPQLKLVKSQVLVLGCGFGHDAAFFAEQGHIVTAIDLSEEAINEGKRLYGHLPNLHFEKADVFNLDPKHFDAYDIVFEHTLYCAINPEQRNKLVKVWRRCLRETGHLLGIFFVMNRRSGPPFGGSEWELREKLEKSFKFLYWTRLKFSPGWRNGAELIMYSRIKSSD